MRDAKLEQLDKLRWNHTFATIAPKQLRKLYPWKDTKSTCPAPPPTEAEKAVLRQIFPKRR
jgi:hypothetical protein